VEELDRKGRGRFNNPAPSPTRCADGGGALLLSSRKIFGGIEWVKTLKGQGAEVPKLAERAS
jgi:D-3-phosphoglycerate dehydrogenase